jgi:hypothetical protein
MKAVALFAVLMGFIGIPALHADWEENGIAICTMTGVQDIPVIVPDGASGGIIAWRDDRVINSDIYAQRVDALGSVLWLGTGMPVCTAPNSQSYPAIVNDGSDGAILMWQDARSGSVLDIYAQRINSDGYIQWQANGVPVCTGQMGLVQGRTIPDGAGGAIIAWHDRRFFTNDVFTQRIGPTGSALWTVNGVTITSQPRNQTYPSLASDGAGGAIIAWQDNRDGAYDIYAQRIDASGSVQWTADGIVVCNAGQSQTAPRVITDGAGGAIIAWTDGRNTVDNDIFAQRIDADGNPLWSAGGVVVAQKMYDQEDSRLIPDGGGAIVTWIDSRSGASWDIYAQKINSSGAPQWTSGGVVVCDAAGDQLNVQLVPNGSGGAVVTWQDGRNGSEDLYAQRIDPDGSSAWTANGVSVCGAAQNQEIPQPVPDGYGGVLITWVDERSDAGDIYSQRIDASGDIGTATLLQSHSADVCGSGIRLAWTLSETDENIDFFILRACGHSMNYHEMPSGGVIGGDLSYSYVDKDCESGETYRYRVDVRSGGTRWILFETDWISIPAMPLALYQNLPNPFNPLTTIRYYVPERCRVALDVYGACGEHIIRLADGYRSEGLYTAVWNGCDSSGRRSGSGVYFYRLKAGKNVLSRKMILLR